MCEHNLPSFSFENLTQPVSLPDDMDRCEHVEEDVGLAVTKMTRVDVCTTEVKVLCSRCTGDILKQLDKEEEEKEQGTTICFDCNKEVSNKDIWPWKWYDFYAPQGDEPLYICKDCRTKDKHLNRVRKDREYYEDEMRGYE